MDASDVKMMALRREGECACGAMLPAGTLAGWHRTRRLVICADCLAGVQLASVVDVVQVEVGLPGDSLQREHDRRVAARQARVRSRFPHIGGILLRLTPTPSTTRAFAIGAEGERAVAEHLLTSVGEDVLFLFNRWCGVGEKYGDIDIVAVAPAGVFVIDPKKYVGRKVRADRGRTVFVVDGRRRTALATSMRRHLDAVTAAVVQGPVADAPVAAAYCFVGANLPLRRLVVDGVPALQVRGVVDLLRQPGRLDAARRAAIHRHLSVHLPPA